MLAQATVVAKTSGTAPILLIDDLVSDLDVLARRQFLGLLANMGSQLLFTTTDLDNVPIPEHVPSAVFHVKHGEVIQIR
jgi:recombinational DNA repair ATPase RecF